ncbi:S8 family serine peptidase [Pseudomonadota bacterium]
MEDVKGDIEMKTKTKTLSVGLWLMLFLSGVSDLSAQSPVAQNTRTAKLQALSQQLLHRDAGNRQQALLHANQMGIPVRRELPNGGVLELQRIAPGIGPIFYITNNLDAADTVSTDEVWPGGNAGLSLDGNGMNVAQWDGGAVFDEHPDFTGRLLQVDGATEVSGHSTHVAGTLAGSGENFLQARGMAYAAHLDAYDWNSDTAEMAAAAASGQLWSNHSYGIAAGWIYVGATPPENWLWIGGTGDTDMEDPNFGYYDTETQLWDQIAFDAPYYLIVKAAGNDRTDIGPAPGEEYTVIDQDGHTVKISTVPRPPDCAPAGYDCLPTNSVAKNVLTVGAVDDLYGGYSPVSGADSVVMAEFSSWGPTDDGRIKPDLVGNGMWLYSTWPDYPYYAVAAGTSMSTPNVTGSLVLLQQHYENLHGTDNFMRASTLKALAIHTADEAGDSPGPDYEFGWGLLNTLSAVDAISANYSGGDVRIIEGTLLNGSTDSYAFDVSQSDGVLTATLVWTDPPGTPPAPVLDPTNLMLVNDLDLRIAKGAQVFMPWVLNPANPSAAATTGDNFRDNVEQVQVSAASTGTYSIQVSHKDGLLSGAPQDYALIISHKPPPPVATGLLLDEDFSAGVLPPGWSVQTDQGVSWQIIEPVPGHSRLDNLTGGSGPFAIVYNQFNRTRTSLRTPVLDLSANDGAVLRFNSGYPYYDTLETLNVDVSLDGGSSWTPGVWQWLGFNPLPSLYVVDLTDFVAGESNVMLAFRFDTGGDPQGDTWQVDNVQLEVFGGGPPSGNPPGQASTPSPGIGTTGFGIDSDLSWTAGIQADSHDLYFGLSAPLGAGDFEGNQPATTFDPGTLMYDTTYYWRVDEVNADGTTTGATWSFSTESQPVPAPPGEATSPGIPDGATGVSVDSNLSWSAGSMATSHDVYFGSTSPLDPADFQGNQSGTDFDPGTLSFASTYYWRIDEVNADGTTQGLEWNFTTETAPVIESVHLSGLDGSAVAQPRGRWSAHAIVTVENQDGGPESGVTVAGSWGDGSSGSSSCLTTSDGSCEVLKNSLKSNVASVSFTVTDMTRTGMTYDPANNTVSALLVISQSDQDVIPIAVNDVFTGEVSVAVTGNVMDNDDPGNGPATIESHTLPSYGSLSLAADGAFIYTPYGASEFTDGFTYRIIDQDGDLSNSATVSIEISIPPTVGNRVVSASPYKVKGVQHVELTWQNFAGGTVDISRDGNPPLGVMDSNIEIYDDNLGVKGSGQTYTYEVCETGTSNCASATASF